VSDPHTPKGLISSGAKMEPRTLGGQVGYAPDFYPSSPGSTLAQVTDKEKGPPKVCLK